jgi:enterochelin esterase-like enzyme
VSCLVWLPPAYEKYPDRKFPVIYWLHGAEGDQRSGTDRFLPPYIKALRDRNAPPAIVVLVGVPPNSFYCDWADGKWPVESVIVNDLIPNIDASFRTQADRGGRMIQGFSMGGLGAARLGLKHPELFGAVAVDSGGPMAVRAFAGPIYLKVFGGDGAKAAAESPVALATKNADALRGKTHIRVGCGADDKLLAAATQLHEALDKLKIPHEFVVVPGVGHDAAKYYELLGAKGFALHRQAFGGARQKP